ncbi:MAG TPA: PD-(D/E)XK nuclease family protein, partial [Symbiobacteriaceae bacterium]|nr:PD-(D/E)XK nuclease family protein [Symbiobacteriaceae bacterium]
PDEDNVYTFFGSALHGALERFNRMRMAGVERPAWADLDGFFTLAPGDFPSDAQRRQLDARGRLFLKRYYDWWAQAPREVVSAEGLFEYDYTDGKGRTHLIRGRYDLIERDAAGNEIIIDYKSGKREPTVTKGLRKSDRHPQKKLQLGLYYLARHGGQVVPGARVAYIFLRHEEDKPPLTWVDRFDTNGEQYISCEHTAQTLQGIRETIDEVIEGILANSFPRVTDGCDTCPFSDVCEVSKRAYF